MLDAPEGVSAAICQRHPDLRRSPQAQEVLAFRLRTDGGDFTIPNVYPGHQVIISTYTRGPYYLESIRLGELDAIASEIPAVSGAQSLTVTYKYGGGSVHGTIEDCGTARVMLIPRDPALRRVEFLRETHFAANGQFVIAAVRPGDYYGFAIGAETSSRWYAAVWDEGLLDRQASKITVRANEHTSGPIRVVKW